jgi:hypothetical protein
MMTLSRFGISYLFFLAAAACSAHGNPFIILTQRY